jgi:hypothetical protein
MLNSDLSLLRISITSRSSSLTWLPLLLAQVEPRALLAYRNAAVMMLSRPVASLNASLIWLGALVFTSATALATIIGLALAASIQQNAFRLVLPNLLPTPG